MHKNIIDTSSGFQTRTPRLGKSVKSNWYKDQDEYIGSDCKSEERAKVLDFILNNSSSKIFFLGFPGERWYFELMLRAECESVRLLGLEKHWPTLVKSINQMPLPNLNHKKYRHTNPIQHGIRYGNTVFDYYSLGDSCRLIHIDSAQYCEVVTTDYGADYNHKKRWNSFCCRNNAVWLDFTSQISNPVTRTLKSLIWTLTPNARIPIAVTVLAARDGIRGDGKRVSVISESLSNFEYKNHWTYIGFNHAPMLTVTGICES